MNEQMQAALIKLIEKAQIGIDTSVSFLSAEIPDVVHQLLMWYAVRSFMWFVLFVLFILLGWHIFRKTGMTKDEAKAAYERKEGWTIELGYHSIPSSKYSSIMGAPCDHFWYRAWGSAMVGVGILFMMANFDWLKIIIAPKIWLIEYAASLAK